jgi:hypothetical protein
MLDAGCWMLDAGWMLGGCSILDAGCWMLDAGWMLDARCSMLDARCSIFFAGYVGVAERSGVSLQPLDL